MLDTFPETNISPENRPLEQEIPIGNHHFQGLCMAMLVLGSVHMWNLFLVTPPLKLNELLPQIAIIERSYILKRSCLVSMLNFGGILYYNWGAQVYGLLGL